MRRIGIYSGTFDPVHAGHIAFGLETLKQLELDEIIYLPEARPRYKTNVTGLEHRLAMLELATAQHVGLRPLSVNSPQFTVSDTLPELQQLFPDSHFTFLLGSDVAHSLIQWPGINELSGTVHFAIGLRGEDTAESLQPLMRTADDLDLKYTFIFTQFSNACSSTIRMGKDIHATRAIAAYAEQNNLYKKQKTPL
jgi:nicotinate (nicotinamide) nucleotide adenylyltransferase